MFYNIKMYEASSLGYGEDKKNIYIYFFVSIFLCKEVKTLVYYFVIRRYICSSDVLKIDTLCTLSFKKSVPEPLRRLNPRTLEPT